MAQCHGQVIGIEIDTESTSKNVRRINLDGTTFVPGPEFYNTHKLYSLRKCVRNRSTGAISYGSNNRGDGLVFNGTQGDALVEIPTMKSLWRLVDDRFLRIHILPSSTSVPYMENYPSGCQRGGAFKPYIYRGAYEGSLWVDSSGNICVQSIAGAQPFTGGGAIKTLPFNSGGTIAITIGETITGATSGATGIVAAIYKSSGDWAAGTAVGTMYLRQVSADPVFSTENLNGSLAGNNCATTTAGTTDVQLTYTLAEQYCNNTAPGMGLLNVWTWAHCNLLMLNEYGTFDIPEKIGLGVVDLPQGTGFAGLLTDADDIDSPLRVNEWGTGAGSGVNGRTPVRWRNIINPYGNGTKFLAGLNIMLSGEYRTILRQGIVSTSIPATLVAGTFDTGGGLMPTDDGYILGVQNNDTLLARTVGGSSSLGCCDKFYKPSLEPSQINISGTWRVYTEGGPWYMSATAANNAACGIFLEYIPQS